MDATQESAGFGRRRFGRMVATAVAGAALSMGVVPAALTLQAAPAEAAANEARLAPGQRLVNGQRLISGGGQFELVMQGDGNLVQYTVSGRRVLWSSGTYGNPGAYLEMQGDGNLVVYTSARRPLWHPRTYGNPGAYLDLQGDGNLVVYSAARRPLWATYSDISTATANTRLSAGHRLMSRDYRYTLIQQGDGNLVLYQQGGGALWNAGTWNNPGAFTVMQGDGNLVVYSASGRALWNAGTWGNPGARLVVQNDANLVVYNGSRPVWARFGLTSGGGGTPPPNIGAWPPADTYPANLRNAGIDALVDPWLFYNRECTSYVAHKLNASGVYFHNTMRGPNGRTGRFGNASNWAANARNIGFPVDGRAARGAIAWWGSGHVAYVHSVNGDGSANISEYNRGYTGRFGYRTVRADAYIHIRDL